MNQDPTQAQGQQPRRRISLRLIVAVLLISMLIPIALVLWRALASGILERQIPEITFTSVPRGVGLIPVTLNISVKDQGSGLDEVVVRLRQKRNLHEILRKSLHGDHQTDLQIELSNQTGDLEEGEIAIEVRAFDRSFWSNQQEAAIPLFVDYHKPSIEVLTTQHNARLGGSQLVFYRATDQNLAISGVRVGKQRFLGFPARGIDPDFVDTSVFVALYAIDPRNYSAENKPSLFAEDRVGNAATAAFYNKVNPRDWKIVKETISSAFIENKVKELWTAYHRSGDLDSDPISMFKFLNQEQRKIDEALLLGQLKEPRFERLWNGPFTQPAATVVGMYGDQINFDYQGTPAGKSIRTGYELRYPVGSDQVRAANSGIVAFAGSQGIFGTAVIVDHGLGLTSLYAQLDSISVKKGERVDVGTQVGMAGTSGLARSKGSYLAFLVHGVPVDGREWWDASWVSAHVMEKIEEAKKVLGIPVYRRLE